MNIIGYMISAAVINLAAVALFAFAMQRPTAKLVPVRLRRNAKRR